MRNRNEVARCIIEILIPYADCFAWGDFGAAGNPCYDPYNWSSPAEEEEEAYTLAAVQLELKKNGQRHIDLAEKVANNTGNDYVTYPYLRDAVSRILASSTYDELLTQVKFSRMIKNMMKSKGLTTISSIEEVLS
ncbi:MULTISPECIES: hypothetical protein [unclassified Ruminococcus]|uniref:hypothetical protein n=1 Tax=unclassified Ruminococcus TaxID=2608920 RepID=UPI00210C492B|nr:MULTISPECIES: hypothetical protein [unclassified Ruminococcus]MCQ4022491.1 hypothetical protein [Ruminococcus sp. zg-924]MCQ4115166.1 hypothetical protein [Ruminococcus sp. zg-921]